MSIEVGEHIPAELESKFLNNLVNSARRMVVLTWAMPGQGGEGHVNGQTAEAIVEKMKIREGVNNKYFREFRMPFEQFLNCVKCGNITFFLFTPYSRGWVKNRNLTQILKQAATLSWIKQNVQVFLRKNDK